MDQYQLDEAEKHVKGAWVVGLISAALTLIFAFVGAYNDDFRYEHGFDTWSLLDVALMAGLTYGIYRKSRFSALGLCSYYVLSKLLDTIASGEFAGGIMSLVFAYFLFRGVRATYAIHKHLVETGEIVKEKRKHGLGYYLGMSLVTMLLLGFTALVVIGFFSPEIEVIPGKQMNKKYLDFVLEQGIVERSEEIQYWYSDGFGDFKDGFYLFTDEKVVVYSQNWVEPAIVVRYYEITDIEFEQDPSFLDDSRITLFLNDGSTIYFPVSSDNGGDEKYYNRLVEVWETASAPIDAGT